MKYHSKIIGTGSYLPKNILTNFDLEKMVETTNDWIISRTGIEKRHIAAEDETAVMMAEQATLKALEAANMKPEAIEMIIIATTTPIMMFPSTACLLQEKLNNIGAPAFDLNATACAGFIYAFSIADQYIRNGMVKNALVIGAEVMSRIVDWEDRSTCILFGDGAGAVILGQSKEPGVLSTHLHSDGRYKDVLYLKMGYRKQPNLETITMTGNQLFKLAVNILGDLFDETLLKSGIKKEQIDWLIPHQANMRIIQAMAKKLNLPLDRVTITLKEQGNTSSASIPLALDGAIRKKSIKPGDLLLLEGFGGGLAWGSALVNY